MYSIYVYIYMNGMSDSRHYLLLSLFLSVQYDYLCATIHGAQGATE